MRRIWILANALLGAAVLWQAGALAVLADAGCHGNIVPNCASGCTTRSSDAWACCYAPAQGYCCQYKCYTIYCDGMYCAPPPVPMEILQDIYGPELAGCSATPPNSGQCVP
jgi:hypothetical protein